MAKTQFKLGAEIDFLTNDELGNRLDHLQNFFQDLVRGQEGETDVRSAAPFMTDSTGGTSTLAAGGGVVYRVPVGWDGLLTRLSVDYEGSNAASPALCDLRVVADQNTPAALRAVFTSVPAVYEEGKSSAPLFRGGQAIVVCLKGGPDSTAIYCTAQVILTPRKALTVDVNLRPE